MAAPHGEHAHEHHLDVSIVSIMLILLIAFTLTSEKLLHAREMHAAALQAERAEGKRQWKARLTALQQELPSWSKGTGPREASTCLGEADRPVSRFLSARAAGSYRQ